MAIVIGLYLYDSMLLLYCNEGVLIPRGKGDWSVGFGSDHARILGKEVFIPNPFLPHRPLFRLSWRWEGNSSEEEENWTAHKTSLGPMAPMVWGMAVALFVFFPLGFFTRLADQMLLSGIMLLYLSIIAALLWLWFNRATFNLSGKRFAALAFESLVCSPFALNLIRTVSVEMRTNQDLVSASRRLQRPDDWNVTCMIIVARLDEEIEGEECGSERMAALQEHRRILTEQRVPCPPLKSS